MTNSAYDAFSQKTDLQRLWKPNGATRRQFSAEAKIRIVLDGLREVLMPWKESSVMEERLRFVARRLDGEDMIDLCREFGISRKTGYKIFNGKRMPAHVNF